MFYFVWTSFVFFYFRFEFRVGPLFVLVKLIDDGDVVVGPLWLIVIARCSVWRFAGVTLLLIVEFDVDKLWGGSICNVRRVLTKFVIFLSGIDDVTDEREAAFSWLTIDRTRFLPMFMDESNQMKLLNLLIWLDSIVSSYLFLMKMFFFRCSDYFRAYFCSFFFSYDVE